MPGDIPPSANGAPPGWTPPLPRAGLLRRLAALIYDSLLILALMMMGTAVLLAFTHGQAITPDTAIYPAYLAFLLGIIAFFYVGFWTHGGQTLGMKAWRLQVRTSAGGPLNVRLSLVRLVGAILSWLPLGLGILWMLIDDNRTWHDRLSGTEIVVLPRSKS
jgi:uncharacterized RDD family membrane protein YckC